MQAKIKVGLFICFAVISITLGQTQWTVRKVDTTKHLRSILWSGERFVVVGYNGTFDTGYGDAFFTSPDGISWSYRNSAGRGFPLMAIKCWKNLLLTFGGNDIMTSPNGEEWTVRYAADSAMIYIEDIAGSDSMLVAVGGNYRVGGRGLMLISTDGSIWTSQTYDTLQNLLHSITWTGEQFVAAGDYLYTSPDGLMWTKQRAGGMTHFSFYDLAWTGERIVAVGYTSNYKTGMIYSSPDGIVWTTHGGFWPGEFTGVTCARNMVFAYGRNLIVASSDGITWELRQVPTADAITDITWAADTYIATCQKGTLLTSPDGTQWSKVSSGTNADLYCLAKSESTIVAVGDSGTILTSPADDVPVAPSSRNPDLLELAIKSTANLLAVEVPVSMRGATVSIYSLAGKRIPSLSRSDAPASFTLNTRDLAPGVYQLVVERRGAKVTKVFAVGR